MVDTKILLLEKCIPKNIFQEKGEILALKNGSLVKVTAPTSDLKALTYDSTSESLLKWEEIQTTSLGFCHVEKLSQTISTNVYQKILVDTVIYDTDQMFDSENNRIKPKQSGYYLVFSQVGAFYPGSPFNLRSFIFKNGQICEAGSFDGFCTTYDYTRVSFATRLLYADGSTDYFELWAYAQTSASSVNLINWGTDILVNALQVIGPLL